MAGSRDLFAIVVFVVISAVFIIVPPLNETPLRAVLGFILVLFVPGYVFVSALFPGNDELDGIERLALSIGLSICIVVLIGIALNYTPGNQAEANTLINFCHHVGLYCDLCL